MKKQLLEMKLDICNTHLQCNNIKNVVSNNCKLVYDPIHAFANGLAGRRK